MIETNCYLPDELYHDYLLEQGHENDVNNFFDMFGYGHAYGCVNGNGNGYGQWNGIGYGNVYGSGYGYGQWNGIGNGNLYGSGSGQSE